MQRDFSAMFPAIFVKVKAELDPTDVIVYQYIAYHYCMANKNSIKITYDELRNGNLFGTGIKLSTSTISKSIKALQKAGMLKVRRKKRKGSKGEYVFLQEYQPRLPSGEQFEHLTPENEVRQNQLLTPENEVRQNQQSQQLTPENRPRSQNSQYFEENPPSESDFTSKHKIRNSEQGSKVMPLLRSQVQEEHDKYLTFASKLRYALAKNNVLMRRVNLNKWKDAIIEFIDETGCSTKRFSKVLKWYCDNIKGDKVPEAFSAQSFCDKFSRIESAMDRIKRSIDPEEEFLKTPPPEEYKPTDEEKRKEEQQMRDSMTHLL